MSSSPDSDGELGYQWSTVCSTIDQVRNKNSLVLCSNLNLGLEVVDEATSPAPPLPFDVALTASFNAATGFVASSTTQKLRRNTALSRADSFEDIITQALY